VDLMQHANIPQPFPELRILVSDASECAYIEVLHMIANM
jgi:hypothetical protein